MSAPKGNQHAYKRGYYISCDGYLRISSGPYRNKYVHRKVIEDLLKCPISYMFAPGAPIPEGMTVEHVDHNKQHNCMGNLMLLDRRIHGKISESYQRYCREHVEEMVEWGQQQDRWD